MAVSERCEIRDPVWDRQCEKDSNHTNSTAAEERLHVHDEPGDKLTWGSVRDMREVNGNR